MTAHKTDKQRLSDLLDMLITGHTLAEFVLTHGEHIRKISDLITEHVDTSAYPIGTSVYEIAYKLLLDYISE